LTGTGYVEDEERVLEQHKLEGAGGVA